MKFLAVALVTVCLVEFSYQLPYGVKGSSNYPSSSTEVKYIHGTESQFSESQGGYAGGVYSKGVGHSSSNGDGQIIFRPDNHENDFRSVHSNKNQGFGSSGIGSSSNGVYNSGGHGLSKGGSNGPVSNGYGPSSSVGIISTPSKGHGSSSGHSLSNGPVSNGYGPSSSVGIASNPSGHGSSNGQTNSNSLGSSYGQTNSNSFGSSHNHGGEMNGFAPSSQAGRHSHRGNHHGGHGKEILYKFKNIHDKIITGFIALAGGHGSAGSGLSSSGASQHEIGQGSVSHGVKGGHGSSVGSLSNGYSNSNSIATSNSNSVVTSNSNSFANSNSNSYSSGSNGYATANAGSSGQSSGPSYG